MQERSRRRVLTALSGVLAGCSRRSQTHITSPASEAPPTSTASTSSTTRSGTTAKPTARDTTNDEPDGATETRSDGALDAGIVYIPFIGDKFGRCTTGCHPSVGHYADPVPSEIVSKQANWISNAGISRVMFNFGEEKKDYERLRTFLSADIRELSVEPFYVISQAMSRDRDIERDFAFLRENLLSTDQCGRIDGRPVVTFWNVDFLVWGKNEESAEALELVEEYGGPEGFVAYLRKQLTVNGQEPFLVGDFFDHAVGGFPARYAELNRQFDGATNWINAFGESNWEGVRNHVEQNFEATRAFCDKHDMEYYPMVYPGFDDRHNSCWGEDRYIPRAPAHLRDLLTLGRAHGTGRVNIATFNDWTEGHQIEPGTFRGTNYGQSYLDTMAQFTAHSEA